MDSVRTALARIAEAPAADRGMDVVIVSTTGPRWTRFWSDRLDAVRGQVVNQSALVLVVDEDWPGGAGNGLGTLYALRKASAVAQVEHGVDLRAALRDGAAVAVYHTAGRGTRLAPLPGSEANNKPGVKLPGLVTVAGTPTPITILEAVIRQTALYADSRRGRVSVFWGDQVFLPSVEPPSTVRHHADILARLGTLPGRADWEARGWSRYGLVAVDASGDAVQLEKLDFDTVSEWVEAGRIGVAGGVGVSLGSFGMSADLYEALAAEFEPELDARSGKLDTDPHFWMPMCLDEATYLALMERKGVEPAAAAAHHQRIARMVAALRSRRPDLGVLGAMDVGTDGYWWDYGQLRGYVRNCRRLLERTPEGDAMRAFFGVPAPNPDDGSIALACRLGAGTVRDSVLIGVDSDHVVAEDAVAVNVAAPDVEVRDGLVYNVVSDVGVMVGPGEVRADACPPGGRRLCFRTRVEADGGQDWDTVLPDNPMSYGDLYRVMDGA